jgi:hypothetical protein
MGRGGQGRLSLRDSFQTPKRFRNRSRGGEVEKRSPSKRLDAISIQAKPDWGFLGQTWSILLCLPTLRALDVVVRWAVPRERLRDFKVSETDRANLMAYDPAAYQSLGALLDELFMNYLHRHVSPYSYGSEWILIGGAPMERRVLAPFQWIGTGNKPIIEVCPDWSVKRPLQSEGLIAGSQWWIISLREQDRASEGFEGRQSGFYGLVTNDERVPKAISSDLKALSFLEDYLPWHPLSEVQLDRFEFRYVFMSAASNKHGQILVCDKNSLNEKISRFLSRFLLY